MTDMPSSEQDSTLVGHTPGPWNVWPFDESQTVINGPEYDGGKRELIATVSVGSHRPRGAANARLISSAPAMLDALKKSTDILYAVTAWLDDGYPTCTANVPDSGGKNECDHCAITDLMAGAASALQASEAALAAAQAPAEAAP